MNHGQAGGHAGSHVGGADAGGEGAQGAVGTGVGVRADDDFTGAEPAPVSGSRACSTPTRPTSKKWVMWCLCANSRALLAKLGSFDVLAGGVVIQYDGDFVLDQKPGSGQPSQTALMATGAVMSLPSTRSSFASMSWPDFHGGQSGVSSPESSGSSSFPFEIPPHSTNRVRLLCQTF